MTVIMKRAATGSAGCRFQEDNMNLIKIKPGRFGRIISIKGEGLVRQRLLDLGLMPDSQFRFERIAPLGYPVWIRLGESQVCLRKKEADLLEIEPVSTVTAA
jgi:Fe2+ transport system protein FeoA